MSAYVDMFDDEGKKLPKSTFDYDSRKGNSGLKFHLTRYHNDLWKAVSGNECLTLRPSGSKRSLTDDDGKPGEAALGTFFRSVKKIKKDSPKATAFAELVTLVIVLARLPFNIVQQPIFKAFVWFFDPSVPLPSREDVTGTLLPRMVSESLQNVLGATVTFDLWMSIKTDDILLVDLHFVDNAWMWRHVHLGLVAMNGNTKGVVIANKLKEVYDDFKLMGRLYAMFFDGGANLSTSKNELQRLHGTDFCCVTLERNNLCITLCLEHLINKTCNGAVFVAKVASYKVRQLPCYSLYFIICYSRSVCCPCRHLNSETFNRNCKRV